MQFKLLEFDNKFFIIFNVYAMRLFTNVSSNVFLNIENIIIKGRQGFVCGHLQ